jgi:Ser/Thr protein kinase RdoA (MazF antagonist)
MIDVRESIARDALVRFGFPRDAALQLVHYRENAVFRVDAAGEAHPWALRVHRVGYRSAVEIRSEIAWMEALAANGIATAPVRRTLDNEVVAAIDSPERAQPTCVSVNGWIHGRALADDESIDTFELVGRTSALIQAHGREWRPPAWFTRPTWDYQRLVGPRALWGDYADLATLAPAQRRLLDRAAASVGAALGRFGRDRDRFGLTHADLMPDNVLVSNGVPYVIDFDDCGYAWYLYDLATLLALRCGDDSYAVVRDAWVAGYRRVTALPESHVDVVDWLVMARLLLGVGWMHTRSETELARALTSVVVEMACAHADKLLASEEAT